MSYESFDDFDSTEKVANEDEQKPFQFREDKSDEGTLDWLNKNFDLLEEKAQSRLRSYRRWAALYKGLHWRSQEVRNSHFDLNVSSKKPKMVNNFVLEFIDARVSQMARFGTNFAAIPWNNELSDENAAKACEKLLKGRADEIDLDKIHREADRIKYKYGTSFLMVKWNKDEGPEHPAYKRLKEVYPEGIPKQIKKQLGEKGVKVGDVRVYAQTPDRIFPEYKAESWTDGKAKVKHFDEVEWCNIHELRAKYPKAADKIEENDRSYYNYDTYEITQPKDRIMVRNFYHPPTEFEEHGEYIKYVDGAILERSKYPFEHGELPMIVDKDIEIEHELWGRPSISQIEQMQRQYNNIDSSQARDLGIGSAPKWMAPKGSIDFRSLGNDFVVAEYKGAVAPQLVKSNPISSDGIVIQDRMEKRMSKLMKVYDISRGEVPSGVTANSALRFLDEQESQILADDERKRKSRVLATYRKMITVMAQYYKADDGRTLRTLGQNNHYQIESMKNADFTKIYDVQFQNTSALPDTKTGKIAAIIDLNAATQADPIFRREDIINMLDMGTDETFTEESTYSLDTAKQLFDAMLQGEEIAPPEMHHDLLVYYTTMFRAIQSYQFISTVDEQTKNTIYTYIKTLEGLIFLKMQKNPKLAMEVQMLSQYPAFFEIPTQPAPTPEQIDVEEQKMKTDQMKNTGEDIESARKADEEMQ